MGSSGDDIAAGLPVNEHGPAHMQLMGSRLFELCNEDGFCDVTITVGGKCFKAHRAVLTAASDYFRAMFSGGFQEQSRHDVSIDGESDVFESILEFIYTGNFHVNAKNVVEVLQMSNYLQITHASAVCADYLTKELTDDKFPADETLPLYDLARIISCASDAVVRHANLLSAAKSYITSNLSAICKQEDFAMNMQIDVLLLILDHGEDLARSYTEDELLKMTIDWLNHDWENRKRFTNQLLKKLRLGLASLKTLTWVLHNSPVQELQHCQELLENVLKVHATGDTAEVPLAYSHPEIFEPRSTITGLIAIGGHTDDSPSFMQYFDDVNDCWIPLEKCKSLPYREVVDHSAVVVNGILYAAGGHICRAPDLKDPAKGQTRNCTTLSNETVNQFHCYDAQRNTWKELTPMKVARDQFSLIHLNTYIYAIGGLITKTIVWDRSFLLEAREFNADPLLNVERFNLDTNKWEDLAYMPRQCYRPVAVVYDGKILLYGPEEYDDSPGEICTYYLMVFYPDTNIWKTVWIEERIAGHRQSLLTVVSDVCYEIRFVSGHRNVPIVRELLLDLQSENPTATLGESQDQSCIESNEVCIQGDVYAVITFPGYVYKKPKRRGSWFHCSNIDGASASVVQFTFDKLRLLE